MLVDEPFLLNLASTFIRLEPLCKVLSGHYSRYVLLSLAMQNVASRTTPSMARGGVKKIEQHRSNTLFGYHFVCGKKYSHECSVTCNLSDSVDADCSIKQVQWLSECKANTDMANAMLSQSSMFCLAGHSLLKSHTKLHVLKLMKLGLMSLTMS